MKKLFFVGCGGVGFCLLEVIRLEKLFKTSKFVIIEPRDIPDLDYVMHDTDYVHVQEFVSVKNYRSLLKELDHESFLVNVSVNVDSIMLLKLCVEKNAHYIDTSIEQYHNYIRVKPEEIERYSQFKKNNLFHQNHLAFKVAGKSKKTRFVSSGENPGFVSQYAKRALIEYGKTKGRRLENGNYAKLGYELGLKEIQVVEYDNQKLKVKATPEKFVNTWSGIGFQDEASDLVMLSLNNDHKSDMEKEFKLIKPTEVKDTHVRFISERGMNMMRESVCLNGRGEPFNYKGMLIPHAEIITLSDFFKYKPPGSKKSDAPTVMYVYHPCDEAMKSLENFRDNGYKVLADYQVVRRKDVISGCDSIGALLVFENGEKFIGSTICSIEDCDKFGLLSGPTCLQVAAYMMGCIRFAMKHKNCGLNNSETIPHKELFKYSEKYMGKSIFKKI